MEQSMVEQEISVMRFVRHPKVVELKEVMVKKAKIFFVMEFKKGDELFAKVAKGKLREDSTRHASSSLSVPSISATTEVSPTAITMANHIFCRRFLASVRPRHEVSSGRFEDEFGTLLCSWNKHQCR